MKLSFVIFQPFRAGSIVGASACHFLCRTRLSRGRLPLGRHGAWRATLADVEGDEKMGNVDRFEGVTDAAQPDLEVGDLGLGKKKKKKEDKADPDSRKKPVDGTMKELDNITSKAKVTQKQSDLKAQPVSAVSEKPKKTETINNVAAKAKTTQKQSDLKAGPVSAVSEKPRKTETINNVAAKSKATEKQSDPKAEPVAAASEKPKKTETRPRISVQQTKSKREMKERQEAVAREKQAVQSEKRKELVMKVTDVLKRAGEKTRAVRLGFEARQKVEDFLARMAAKKEKKQLESVDKLQVTAAELIRKSSSVLSTKFDELVVPAVKKRLPEELRAASNAVIASGLISVAFAFTLFPTFFLQGPQKAPERKQIDAQTAYLERKLRTPAKPSSSPTDKSLTSKTTASIFPDDDKDQSKRALYPPKLSTPSTATAQKAQTPKGDIGTAKGTAPSSSPKTLAKKPDDSLKPTTPVPQPLSSPSGSLKAEKSKAGPVTAAVAATTVKAGLGSQQAALVTAVDFDSLAPTPTIMITVSSDFRRLPTDQQTSFTRAALTSARSLDFDGVSVVDDSGDVLSYGGLTVTLSDETRALRTKIDAVRKDMRILAGEKADYLSEVHSLTNQLRENDEKVAKLRANYEGLLKSVRAENAQLGQDLARAETEIAKLPDVEVLMSRTEAAEADSAKMAGTVEMLSRRVTAARDAESAALAEKRAAEENAMLTVTTAQENAKKEVDEAHRLVAEAEEKVKSEQDLREKNQQIASQEKDKAVDDVVAKYTRLLDDMQKKYMSEMGVSQKQAEQKYASLESSFKDKVKSLEEQNSRLSREVKATQDQGRAQKSAWEKERNRLGEKVKVLETRLAAQKAG